MLGWMLSQPTIRVPVVIGVVALASLLPLVMPDPAALLSLRGALATFWLAVVMSGLYALQARPLHASVLEHATLTFLVMLGLTGLSFAHRGMELIPSLFALSTLGARLPPRWVLWQSVPLVAYLMWLFDRGDPLQPYSLMSNALGLFGLLYLGFTIHRQHSLSLQLQHANDQLARKAEQEGELSRLRERERLARDLHDTLGHALSTLTMHLEAVRRLAVRAPERLPSYIDDAQTLARQALRDLRSTLDDLRTSDTSLHHWIAERATRLAEHHHWTLVLNVQPVSLPPQTTQDLQRIAGEALENVVRHARASRVQVELQETGGELRFVIEDDGCGFDAAAEPEGHYGLRGMRERATLLGGKLLLSTHSGGTRLMLHVPLRASEVAERTLS